MMEAYEVVQDGGRVIIKDRHGEVSTLAVHERLNALTEALAEAHRILLHETDNGRTPYMLKRENGGKGLGYFEDVLSGAKR